MIRYVTEETLPALLDFCRGDPFGCKIASLALAYGLQTPFAGFWLQTKANTVAAALSRLEDAAVLFAHGQADWEEWESFLSMLSVSTVQCRAEFPLLADWKREQGIIMKLCVPLRAAGEAEPALAEVHPLLASCEGPGFHPPPFDPFYVDMSHRIRHGTARVRGVWEGDALIACAMTVAETGTDALLGAVAVHPGKRRGGYGGRVVRALCAELLQEKKEIFLFRSETDNQAFYEGLGFSDCGRWSELERI